MTPKGLLPYVTRIGMCHPKGYAFVPFWSEKGYRLSPFWSRISVVFKGTTAVHEHIILLFQFLVNETEEKKSFLMAI